MKKRVTIGLVVVLGASLLVASQVMSGDKGAEPPMPDMEKMMAMYEKLGQPGPEHARFKEAVGTWHTETKMWMGPGEPTVSTGTSEMSVILGGRYMQEKYRCDSFMGKPFAGMALVGFDNHKKKYFSIWIDTFSTFMMTSEGTYDESGKTLTMVGHYDDPFMGPTTMKNVMREISKDKHVFEMFRVGPDGKEKKEMEITYTRKKS